MQTSTPATQKPWYRQFWPWFLISIPLASVFLSSIMLMKALDQPDTLVVDNYYKEGLAINEALGQDQAAHDLGLKAIMQFSNESRIQVELSANRELAPEFLVLRLLHPTLAEEDQQVALARQPDGSFVGQLAQPISGRRYLDLLDGQRQWRLKDEVVFPVNRIELVARVSN